MGSAMMGSGAAEGDDRAVKAADLALKNPLLGDLSVRTAKGMLVNITGAPTSLSSTYVGKQRPLTACKHSTCQLKRGAFHASFTCYLCCSFLGGQSGDADHGGGRGRERQHHLRDGF